MDHLCVFVSCVSHAFASVHCCLVVTCWERADLLALVGDVYCMFVTFPCGILGQVWYLIYLFLIFAIFLTLFLLCFRARLVIDALWSPAGKGRCLIVKLSLSHPGYLIVSIPDLCPLSYFNKTFYINSHIYINSLISQDFFTCQLPIGQSMTQPVYYLGPISTR